MKIVLWLHPAGDVFDNYNYWCLTQETTYLKIVSFDNNKIVFST